MYFVNLHLKLKVPQKGHFHRRAVIYELNDDILSDMTEKYENLRTCLSGCDLQVEMLVVLKKTLCMIPGVVEYVDFVVFLENNELFGIERVREIRRVEKEYLHAGLREDVEHLVCCIKLNVNKLMMIQVGDGLHLVQGVLGLIEPEDHEPLLSGQHNNITLEVYGFLNERQGHIYPLNLSTERS